MDAYKPKPTLTGATISVDGDTLNLVIDNGGSIGAVSGTGLMDLAESLLVDNTILVTFPDGQAVRLSQGSNDAAVKTALTPYLSQLATLPATITVTVQNAASGASVQYTVNVSEAEA